MKTSVREVPVVNGELYSLTARLTRADRRQVKQIIHFTGEFIAATVRAGTMQGVQLPYFGKFKPKKTRVEANYRRKVLRANGGDVLLKAMKGRDVL
jgi:hypothetical protein